MGNFSLYGILLIVGVFFFLSSVLLALINVDNPYTGIESSVLELILDWII